MQSTKQPAARPRHIPQRSCVACRETRAKNELIRLVRSATSVEVDPKGKKAGRGAYLCPKRECWETGLKGNRLEHTLHTRLTPENRQLLLDYGKELPG